MTYGLPGDTRIWYGEQGFPQWVYQMCDHFGIQASTYRGHQADDRKEAGYSPNPGLLNRGIDWRGKPANLTRFADYLMSIKDQVEQVIWENPTNGRRYGVGGRRDVTNTSYYNYDGGYNKHRDHLHTRQSSALPIPSEGNAMTGWTGNMPWLADVVRPACSQFVEHPGWRTRSHGTFKDVRGIMIHHMGGRGGAATIANGRPDLAGPLSQFHVSQKGVVTVVASGVAWHAGVGSYPWLPTNMGNWHLIGIECEGPVTPGISPATQTMERWPDVEIIALRNLCAALLMKLAYGSDRLLGHKDYAGRAQGKWDPWNLDVTGWFADEVAKDLAGFIFPGEGSPTTTPPPNPMPVPPVDKYANVLLYRGIRGKESQIRVLQERLHRNYSRLVVDGDYGQHTEACVRDYQKLHPPLAADGIVGPATAASLRLAL